MSDIVDDGSGANTIGYFESPGPIERAKCSSRNRRPLPSAKYAAPRAQTMRT
jgi:hypothetical protein